MRTPLSSQLFQYWTDLRSGRPMPKRSEVDPAALARLLPDIFILEALPDGEHRFRLAGTRVCQIFGRELRHAQFSSIWRQDQDRQTARAARRILDNATPMRFAAGATNRFGDRLQFDLPLLPLAGADGQPAKLIGAIEILGTPFSEAILPIAHLEQTGLAVLANGQPEPMRQPAPVRDKAWEGLTRRIAELDVFQGRRAKI